MTSSNGLECEFNNQAEQEYLFLLLNKQMDVLEWGSGLSTLAIAKRVNSITSVEHDRKYYKSTFDLTHELDNVSLWLVEQNNEPTADYTDGTYEDFQDYILFPASLNKKYDLIFIDGRARVDCAREALMLLKNNGIIVIHDIFHPDDKYRRLEYDCVTDFLKYTGGAFALHSFTHLSTL